MKKKLLKQIFEEMQGRHRHEEKEEEKRRHEVVDLTGDNDDDDSVNELSRWLKRLRYDWSEADRREIRKTFRKFALKWDERNHPGLYVIRPHLYDVVLLHDDYERAYLYEKNGNAVTADGDLWYKVNGNVSKMIQALKRKSK